MLLYFVFSAVLAQPVDQQGGPSALMQHAATVPHANPKVSPDSISRLIEGYWGVENLRLVSDVCQLNNFQDVQEFVPEAIKVSKSQEGMFYLDFDTPCELREGRFECATQNFTEPALLGTTTIKIRNMLSGQILDQESLRIQFTVAVDSCEGFGCWGVSSLLDFPCSVVLTATARH